MTEKTKVLALNGAFYEAMRAGDIAAMDELWARKREVSCTHPSGPPIIGRAEVMESWRLIFGFSGPVQITESECSAIITGKTAMVLCREAVGSTSMMASNTFQLEDGHWRMINHQASPFL
ncbi:nuclear transport factor 2 family protein [Rhodobacteraceae bacterium NNCM2]|nr:nuclear transport factor 2 family protein [Coraliihabitans acroporae]